MSAARTKSATEAAMVAALVVAREFISTDRNSLADASIGTDCSRDADDQAALNDYDQALKQIDAAIALGDGGSELAAADDEPAFPVVVLSSTGTPVGQSLGMSMRDFFAAKAMQARIQAAWVNTTPAHEAFEEWKKKRPPGGARGFDTYIAEHAYFIADAMLTARQGSAA